VSESVRLPGYVHVAAADTMISCHVELTVTSTVVGSSRTYQSLDELVADVADARVWGGLHYRTTMDETAKEYPRIAREVGKRFFLRTAH
jgi:hypothetical protein